MLPSTPVEAAVGLPPAVTPAWLPATITIVAVKGWAGTSTRTHERPRSSLRQMPLSAASLDTTPANRTTRSSFPARGAGTSIRSVTPPPRSWLPAVKLLDMSWNVRPPSRLRNRPTGRVTGAVWNSGLAVATRMALASASTTCCAVVTPLWMRISKRWLAAS